MRACIGIYKPEDLWFNQGIELKEEAERVERLAAAQEMIERDLQHADANGTPDDGLAWVHDVIHKERVSANKDC